MLIGMSHFKFSICIAVVSLPLLGCASTSSTSTNPTATPASAATVPVLVGGELQLALTIHVEGYSTEGRDVAEFERHIAVLEQLADLAVAYEVVLNFELSSDFVQAVDNWGSTFIENMTALGHNISQHSGDRSTEGLTGAARVAELVRQREAIEAHGVTVNYASGGCSADDWVESAIAAGLSAVTGNVEFCLKSLDDASLPVGMEWIQACENPAICHDPLHLEIARVLHPWTTSSSANWLSDDPDGGLVIVAGSDADAFTAMSQGAEVDVNAALEQWNELLDASIAASVSGQVNVVNVVLSVGQTPDWELTEAMFAQAKTLQASGLLQWVSLSEIVAQALAEAPTQVADATGVYTDTTPDLAGRL